VSGADGPPGLAAALEEFGAAWRHGLQRTGEAAQVASGRLQDAVAVYTQVECAVSRVCA
jgi:hypothetical protein